MKRGFTTIMVAQFFSSLADNALFVVAVELLVEAGAPQWQRAGLVPMFALFYVLLAPWVGAFADSRPKGQVMFISNAIKIVGCLMMLFGSHPVLSYAVVGLGAATYSPAKYGILTELLPPSQLVKGNGWMEGLTIASIVLGVLLGGQLVNPQVAQWLQVQDWSAWGAWAHSAPHVAIIAMAVVYVIAAIFNIYIPRTGARMRRLPRRAMWLLLPDFWRCNRRMWHDRLGQISLATTTLFWGVSGNMRYIVLAWAAVALGYNTAQGATLVGVVILGTALGAVVVSIRVRLEHTMGVMPLGFLMGLVLMGMALVHHVAIAAPALILLGALGGYIVVPMNALLQHRGQHLVGAGRSIAVQNFNEQACILFSGLVYSAASGLGLSPHGAIVLFGVAVIVSMAVIQYWWWHNCRHHTAEVNRLLQMAGSDHIPERRIRPR